MPPAAAVGGTGRQNEWNEIRRRPPGATGSLRHLLEHQTGSLSGESASILRLLDANLDRAREGLRVLEEWARYGLDRPDLVARSKDLRQRLGLLHSDVFKLSRDAQGDPAAGMGHPAQGRRERATEVVAANAGRVQEALRVLEEFGRSVDPILAGEATRIRYLVYDLEVELLRAVTLQGDRRRRLHDCTLYLITQPVPDLEGVVEEALAAGVRLVQYRSKSEGESACGDDLERLDQARRLHRLCRSHEALFIVNDRIDLALAVDADGVHLGQGDLPPSIARRLLGPDRLIGRSTHDLQQLRQAVAEGCDYVGVGPVHATPTKAGRAPVGLTYVREAADESPIPFFAIGGIDADGVPAVQAAGAERVAVVRGIMTAADPGAATKRLLARLGEVPCRT